VDGECWEVYAGLVDFVVGGDDDVGRVADGRAVCVLQIGWVGNKQEEIYYLYRHVVTDC